MFSLIPTLGVKAAISVTWLTRRAARSSRPTTATLSPTSRVSCTRFWAVTVTTSTSGASVEVSAARAGAADASSDTVATPPNRRARPAMEPNISPSLNLSKPVIRLFFDT